MSSVIGWSLVHFLWQGALIALLLEAALAALQNRSSELRYAVRCGALVAMGLAPVITFAVLTAGAPPPLPREALLAAALSGLEPVRGLAWTDAVVVGWSLGASYFAARLLRDWMRVRRLQAIDTGALLPLAWQVRFDDLAELLQVKAVARVVDSASLAAPTVIGWMKPVVLVPARVLTGLSQDQIEALLAHELAHVRRHDYLVNLVQSAVEALLFYHPAVWWVSNGIRAEREYCCDDVALCVTHNRLSYARALTTLEGWRGVELEIAMSTLGGPLMQRIQRLVGVRSSHSVVRGPLAACAALLVLAVASSAFGHDPAGPQDAAQIRELQAEIEAMESRLAELKAQLARTQKELHRDFRAPEENVWVTRGERIHGDGDVRVLRRGNNQVFELKGDAHGEGHNVWRFEDEGGEKQIVVEIRGLEDIPMEVHEHVRDALRSHGVNIQKKDRSIGIGGGEAEVLIEVLGDDGERDVIKRRVKIDGIHGKGGNVTVDLEDLHDLEQLHEQHNRLLDRDVDRLHEHAQHLHERAERDHARAIELHLEGLEGLEQLHELKELENLRHIEEIDVQKLHEHLMKAFEKANVEVHGLGDGHGNVRILKLDDLGELEELKELEDFRFNTFQHAGQDGKVRVRLEGDVKLDVHDDLLDKIRKARVEIHERADHHDASDGDRQQPKKVRKVVDQEIV